MSQILIDAQGNFLDMMAVGWASGDDTKIKQSTELADHYDYLCFKGRWKLLDRFCVAKGSARSAGQTYLWYNDEIIWTMHYQGSYALGVLPFLQHCLFAAYSTGQFFGGRGLAFHEDPAKLYMYSNVLIPGKASFADFAGKDQIARLSDRALMGWHNYWGQAYVQ